MDQSSTHSGHVAYIVLAFLIGGLLGYYVGINYSTADKVAETVVTTPIKKTLEKETDPYVVDSVADYKVVWTNYTTKPHLSNHYIVAQSITEWKSRVGNVSEIYSVDDLDFGKTTLVLISGGEKPSKGYPVEITLVDEKDTSINITANQLGPLHGAKPDESDNDPAREALVLIRLPKTEKQIIVTLTSVPNNGKKRVCRDDRSIDAMPKVGVRDDTPREVVGGVSITREEYEREYDVAWDENHCRAPMISAVY